MREIHDRASAQLEANAKAVFELITDIERLPEWNAAIEKVLTTLQDLSPGAEWAVQMHPDQYLALAQRRRLDLVEVQQFGAAVGVVPDLLHIDSVWK